MLPLWLIVPNQLNWTDQANYTKAMEQQFRCKHALLNGDMAVSLSVLSKMTNIESNSSITNSMEEFIWQ